MEYCRESHGVPSSNVGGVPSLIYLLIFFEKQALFIPWQAEVVSQSCKRSFVQCLSFGLHRCTVLGSSRSPLLGCSRVAIRR